MKLAHTDQTNIHAGREFEPDGSHMWRHEKHDNGVTFIGPHYNTLAELLKDTYRYVKIDRGMIPDDLTPTLAFHAEDVGKLLMVVGKMMWNRGLIFGALVGEFRDEFSDEEIVEELIEKYGMDEDLCRELLKVNLEDIS